MREEKKLGQPIISYIYRGKKKFFVSTICRKSSSSMYNCLYYETFGWSMKGVLMDKIIADNSGALTIESGLKQHQEVCRQLLLKGEFEQE